MGEVKRDAAGHLLAGEGFDPRVERSLARALSALDEVVDLPFNSVRRRLNAARECLAILEDDIPTGNIDPDELILQTRAVTALFRGEPIRSDTRVGPQLTAFLEKAALTACSPLNEVFRIGIFLCSRYSDHPVLRSIANGYSDGLRTDPHFLHSTGLFAEIADRRIEDATFLTSDWRFGDRQKCVEGLLSLIDEDSVIEQVRQLQTNEEIPPFPQDYKSLSRSERPDPIAFFLDHYLSFGLFRFQLKELEPVLHDAVVNKMTSLERSGRAYEHQGQQYWSLSDILPQKKARLDLIGRLIPESVQQKLEAALISLRLRS